MKNLGIYYIIPFASAINLFTDLLRQFWLLVTDGIGVLLMSFVCVGLSAGADIAGISMAFLLADVSDTYQKIFLLRNVTLLNSHFIFSSVIVILSVLSIGFFAWRIHLLRKKTGEIITEQEFLVNDLEKTISELENSKEESLQQQLFMRRLAMVLTHDLQSPFRFLITNTEELHERILNKDYKDSEALSKELKLSGEKTLRFLMDFTIWMKSISNGYKLRLETVALLVVFTEIEQFFSEQMKAKKNVLNYKVEGALKVITDRELLKIVLRNIVDNANKHCEEGIIKMEATRAQGFCSIIISDNGKGMSEATLEKIKEVTTNHKPYNICPESDERQGYKFISHFSQLLQMELAVTSEPLKGTSVRLAKLNIDVSDN